MIILIKDEKFRNLFNRFVVIKDKDFAQSQHKFFLINLIMGKEDLFNVALKLNNYPIDDNINSVLVLPFVDHGVGLSFLTVATCFLDEDKLLIYEREDSFEIISNLRFNSVKDFEFEYLDNLKINADFPIDDYISYAFNTVKSDNDDNAILTLRMLTLLDDFRNKEYPDDVLVAFFKKGYDGEGMWVRYEDHEGTDIFGTLLNQPNQELGVNKGDTVQFRLIKNNNDELVCICDLDE